MFYEDQHQLAAYLERTGAEWEYLAGRWHSGDDGRFKRARGAVFADYDIRPVLRYGLPSHLQSEIHNPDNLTEEQICEGGKYRCAIASENDGRFGTFKFNQCQVWNKDSNSWKPTLTEMLVGKTIRLPANVPWPDWEREEAAKPDPKDARIAELKAQCSEYRDKSVNDEVFIMQLQERLSASPWRRMSEVPTEEDKKDERFLGRWLSGEVELIDYRSFDTCVRSNLYAAWMPFPKFHGWPDPLADLLKSHGVEATPELTAALNAWKGVGE